MPAAIGVFSFVAQRRARARSRFGSFLLVGDTADSVAALLLLLVAIAAVCRTTIV